jgi:hypothetical protein
MRWLCSKRKSRRVKLQRTNIIFLYTLAFLLHKPAQ